MSTNTNTSPASFPGATSSVVATSTGTFVIPAVAVITDAGGGGGGGGGGGSVHRNLLLLGVG